MSTSLLYHAFGIREYKYVRTEYNEGHTIFTIKKIALAYGVHAAMERI